MGLAEKIVGGLVVIALATTLFAKDRTFVQALSTTWDGFTKALKTSMGR